MLNWRCSSIFTVKKEAREEIIEKKSRFIGTVIPIKSKEEAEEKINEIKKEFWDARHNVYAYNLPNNISKYSDDGEPQGTAGLPVFTVLQKREIINVLVIVTRYFGGILLGKGGLIRAYTEAAKKALEAAEVYEIIEYERINIECEYNLKDKVLFFLEKHEIQHTSIFSDKVTFEITIPKIEVNDFIQDVIKLTENRITYSILSK